MNPDQAFAYLNRENRSIGLYSTTQKPVISYLKRLNRVLLGDHRFHVAPGSVDKHHAYEGGLIVHTSEVIQVCSDQVARAELDWPVLFTAALWHDYGKIWDYERNHEYTPSDPPVLGSVPQIGSNGVPMHQEWMKADHCKKIRHLARSYAEFIAATRAIPQPEVSIEPTIDAISHCMLAHHGRQDWGSPIEPQTPEAFALHLADMISVKVIDGDKAR